MTGLKALIFDVDGTLAETEEAHRLAFNAAFRAAGLDWSWDVDLYRELLAVTGGKERIRWFVKRGDPPDGERALSDIDILHAAKTAYYRRAVERGEVELRPGVRRLIEEAQAAGLRLAVATTTTAANIEALIVAAFGRSPAELFEVVVAGEDVCRKKPDPEVYLLALQRLDLPAVACIAFEDIRTGTGRGQQRRPAHSGIAKPLLRRLSNG